MRESISSLHFSDTNSSPLESYLNLHFCSPAIWLPVYSLRANSGSPSREREMRQRERILEEMYYGDAPPVGRCALNLLGTMDTVLFLSSHSSVAEAAGWGWGLRVGRESTPHHWPASPRKNALNERVAGARTRQTPVPRAEHLRQDRLPRLPSPREESFYTKSCWWGRQTDISNTISDRE